MQVNLLPLILCIWNNFNLKLGLKLKWGGGENVLKKSFIRAKFGLMCGAASCCCGTFPCNLYTVGYTRHGWCFKSIAGGALYSKLLSRGGKGVCVRIANPGT